MTPSTDYVIEWLVELDAYDWADIEMKGWFAAAAIHAAGHRYEPMFYEPIRLHQEIRDALARTGCYAERNVVVVSEVTRERIEGAIAHLAKSGFAALVPEKN